MAFFDKLKDVAGKAKEAAVKAAAAASEFAEQAKEKEAQRRQAAEEAEAARKAEAEARRVAAEETRLNLINTYKERILDAYMNSDWDTYDEQMENFESIAHDDEDSDLRVALDVAQYQKCGIFIKELAEKTDCDLGQGDCGWLGLHFYCTCCDVDCPKKKYISEFDQTKPYSPEHLPYIKFLSKFYTQGDLKFVDEETRLEFLYAFRLFFVDFLPEHTDSLIGDDSSAIVAFVLAHGFGMNNPVMDILFSIHEQTDGKIVPPIDLLIAQYDTEGADLTKPYFKNPSLYDRSREDIEYTMAILNVVSEPSVWEEATLNPEEVSFDKLFNEDGSIKEAGIGGPRKGFYGDVLYNIINSWMIKEE